MFFFYSCQQPDAGNIGRNMLLNVRYMNKIVGRVWTGHTIFVIINQTENLRIT